MLVSNEDFMPTKPTNKNLIDQMKKKISSKENSQTQGRSRSKTLIMNSKSSLNQSSDVINAGHPVNFQASNQPQHLYSTNPNHSLKSFNENQEDSGSFISNTRDPGFLKNNDIKDLSMFEKEELPHIREKGSRASKNDSEQSSDDKYDTHRIYKDKLEGKHGTKNVILREMRSSGMDGVDSLSSGYTEDLKDEEEGGFKDYLFGFFCGFFLSIFGVIFMLFCTNKRKRCEGATHGMILSGIVLIVVFNGYFFNIIKDMETQGMSFIDSNSSRSGKYNQNIKGNPYRDAIGQGSEYPAMNNTQKLEDAQPKNVEIGSTDQAEILKKIVL